MLLFYPLAFVLNNKIQALVQGFDDIVYNMQKCSFRTELTSHAQKTV